MKNKFHLGFFFSAAACFGILCLLPLDKDRFARSRLGPLVQSDVAFRDAIAAHCSKLEAHSDAKLEAHLLELLPLASQTEEQAECQLFAEGVRATPLGLRDYWDFQIQVRNADGMPIADQHFQLDVPTPLVLWPLIVYLLALVYGFKFWDLSWAAGTFFFFASGANLVQGFKNLGKATQAAFSIDQPWLGLLLLLLWVALCRGRRTKLRLPRHESPEGRWLNRILLGGLALWKPMAFSLTGRLLVPFRGGVARTEPFFTLQAAAVLLSVYLLAASEGSWQVFFHQGLALPRYFTFSALLFLALQHRKLHTERAIWHLPAFWRTAPVVAAVELFAAYSSWFEVNTTLRVGLALVAGQLLWPFKMAWKRVLMNWLPWAGRLVLAALIAVFSAQLSVTDLALQLFHPQMHPTGIVFFTFLSGIGLGFITGSFPLAYFTVFVSLTPSAASPLVRAALLDGIVAGLLLSPFSVYNLIPAAQFGLPAGNVLVHRFRQFSAPLAIGSILYAVSAISSVAILRPATFVFLCLVAVVLRLKKSSWKLGNYTISLTAHSAEH